MAAAKDISGLARGIAFRLSEGLGVLRREAAAQEVRTLDQPARSQLRNYGVRFGAFNIYFPVLLKPAAVELSLVLWMLKNGAAHGVDIAKPPEMPRPGLTSLAVDKALPEAFYRVAGYHPCGARAVRIDMLERLADQIRPLVAWRPDPASASPPPKGATGDGGFRVTPEMMSIMGCSSGGVAEVLQTLGFRLERVPLPKVEEVPAPAATAPAATDAATGVATTDGAVETSAGADAAASDVPVAPTEVAEPSGEEAARPTGERPSEKAPKEAKEARWDEVWRPRRQGRKSDRPRRRRGALTPTGKPEAEAARPQQRDREAWRGRRQRKQGPGGRRDDRDRTRPRIQSAAPPPKTGVDPDSPFAALSSLKAALERQSQE